jgi:hypothetical protein
MNKVRADLNWGNITTIQFRTFFCLSCLKINDVQN